MKSSFDLKFETISGKYDTVARALKVQVHGDLKSTTVEALQRDLSAMLASDNVRMADLDLLDLDLKEAAVIDSQGLNLLVAVLKQMKLRCVPVRARVDKRPTHLTLLAVGMDRQLDLVFEQKGSVAAE